jgi:hypothetical protein
MANVKASELVGASDGPIELSGETTKVDLLLAPASTAEAVRAEPRHIYLNLENITGAGIPGDYLVYLELPDDNLLPSLAGVMTTFGLEMTSDTSLSYGGSGLTQVFEITELATRLKLTNAGVSRLKVTFVREGVVEADNETPSGLSGYAVPTRNPPAVRVGRISLFYD